MGCFDTVQGKCSCGGRIEWQSKAGECALNVFPMYSVPLAIASDLSEDRAQCDLCEKEYKLKMLVDIRTVAMQAVEIGEEDEDE